MRDDIYGGLKNAIEKGESLDSAVQSFINAGYSSLEVKEAAQAFGYGGGMSIVNQGEDRTMQSGQQAALPPQAPRTNYPGVSYPSSDELRRANPSSGSSGAVIFLIIILLFLIAALGGVFLFKDKLIEFFSNL